MNLILILIYYFCYDKISSEHIRSTIFLNYLINYNNLLISLVILLTELSTNANLMIVSRSLICEFYRSNS